MGKGSAPRSRGQPPGPGSAVGRGPDAVSLAVHGLPRERRRQSLVRVQSAPVLLPALGLRLPVSTKGRPRRWSAAGRAPETALGLCRQEGGPAHVRERRPGALLLGFGYWCGGGGGQRGDSRPGLQAAQVSVGTPAWVPGSSWRPWPSGGLAGRMLQHVAGLARCPGHGRREGWGHDLT